MEPCLAQTQKIMLKSILIKLIPSPLLKRYRQFRISREERQRQERESREVERLKAKWLKHKTIQEWISKGWIRESDLNLFWLSSWEATEKTFGEPVPHPAKSKQGIIAATARRTGARILVETGTYLGDMVNAQLDNFDRIYTIEIDGDLYKRATERFREHKHVHLFLGDSGKVLPGLVEQISEPALFWLDGHYSHGITGKGEKDCPIYEELDAILKTRDRVKHVILIDDIRCFNGKDYDYPAVQDVIDHVRSVVPECSVDIAHDIMTISY